MGTLTAFEQQREDRILANKRRLQAMGVLEAKEDFEKAITDAHLVVPKRRRNRVQPPAEPTEPRRSLRAKAEVDYREEQGAFNEKLPGTKAERKVKYIDREDIDLSIFTAPRQRSAVDSGRGVRVQGGRVYDSRFGVTCHWCRQKTVENKVTCTNSECGKGSRLPVSFCKMCLKNRHGEDVEHAELSGNWICPCCRVSCGEGCTLCCNCGPCRKKKDLSRQQLIQGIDTTGEASGDIAARKNSFAWGYWMQQRNALHSRPADTGTTDSMPGSNNRVTLMDTYPAAKQISRPHSSPEKQVPSNRDPLCPSIPATHP